MTDAEFRVVREHLGLDQQWIADRLGVALRSVQRWENDNNPVPDGVRRQMEAWEQQTAVTVGLAVDRLRNARDLVVATYRDDATYRQLDGGGWSARWHRAMVGRVCDEVPGVVVVYRTVSEPHAGVHSEAVQ